MSGNTELLSMVRAARRRLAGLGPPRSRSEGDFERVALPDADGDVLRDLLISERARVVIEIGLAYGSSALAIGEALLTTGHPEAKHVIIDAYQDRFLNIGEFVEAAGHARLANLVTERSQLALPRLLADGFVADAAYVDGSHIFHNVFVDLYILREIVRPGGLIVLDDCDWRITRERRRTGGSIKTQVTSNASAARSCSCGTCRRLQRSCWTLAEARAGTRPGSPHAVTPCTWSIPSRCMSSRRGRARQPNRMLRSRVSARATRAGWTGQPSKSIWSSRLGPLYHLTERGDRIRALNEAWRVLRSNGVVLVAAISRFASARDGLARHFFTDPRYAPITWQDLADGQHRGTEDAFFTTAYLHHPDELEGELIEAGFGQTRVLAIQGPVWLLQDLDRQWEDPMLREITRLLW
jgi:predicted O-methyltransferase YrrM